MDVLERAREVSWYHTLELAPGEVTPGVVDLRPHVEKVGLPARMDGLRALDVGTFDGFWAFEMERRGAEVVAIDVDADEALDRPPGQEGTRFDPRGPGFQLASEALGSNVVRHDLSVYEATPERLGVFDLVFCGSVLIHLRDQVLALTRLAELCGGSLIAVEAYHRRLALLPFALAHFRALRPGAPVFWEPNVRAWRRMIEAAGFAEVRAGARFTIRSREGWSVPHVVLRARK